MPDESTALPATNDPAVDSADSFLREAAAIDDLSMDAIAARLTEGEVVADRFVVERLAGRGGMGVVYRAFDRRTEGPVALKIMTRSGGDDERFAREARVLADLSHPAIVRYVSHGTTATGALFLAMEWLDGEDLDARLARAGLSVAESLAVARRVAEGLAAAHALGVVHRDVKPSNMLLVGADPARAKLLDFGVVRLQLAGHAPTARAMTRTGMVIGTVGYMSPEQAVADRALDARTDVFALGCVLFECLTGQPAFSGAHVVAVLAKVLREEAPRVRQLRPELPAALDDLVARMLSKDKRSRPADGTAFLRDLDALGILSGGVPQGALPPSVGLSGGERRFVSVMLALAPDEPERIGAIVARHGGDLSRLANGAWLVTMSARGADQRAGRRGDRVRPGAASRLSPGTDRPRDGEGPVHLRGSSGRVDRRGGRAPREVCLRGRPGRRGDGDPAGRAVRSEGRGRRHIADPRAERGRAAADAPRQTDALRRTGQGARAARGDLARASTSPWRARCS